MNRDITYCEGNNCRLRETCLRFLEGNRNFTSEKRMKNCDPETREGYWSTTTQREGGG